MEIELLLPLVCAWAETQEQQALRTGAALMSDETLIATAVGVRHPERVRLLEVERIPAPDHPLLRSAAANAGLSLEYSNGMALRYGIFLCSDLEQRRQTIAHELTHTMQYERLGGFAGFFRQYITECLTVGYWQSPLELEAVEAANPYVH